MIIHDVQQGSTEWLRLRSGIPTSSAFHLIMTPKGKPSASAEKYLQKLLAERMMGHPCIEHISMWQQRGSQMEKDAVLFYELQRNVDTEVVGFVTNNSRTIGSSPDRFVGQEGQLEIKVPSEGVHVGFLLKSGSAYEEYQLQTQGQLWITGRPWCDLLSWHPEMPPAIIRIERDEPFIKLLSMAVETFSLELERMSEELVKRGWKAAWTTSVETKSAG